MMDPTQVAPPPPELDHQVLAQTNNPILAEIAAAHSKLSPGARTALAASRGAFAPPATPEAPQVAPPDVPLKPLAAPQPPVAALAREPAPPSEPMAPKPMASPTMTPAKLEQQRLAGSKPGEDQIHNKLGRVLARVGDVALSTFFPAAAALTPGTQYHHQFLQKQADQNVGSEDLNQKNADESRLHNAQATEQESLPELHKTQSDLAAEKVAGATALGQAKNQETATAHRNEEELARTKTEGAQAIARQSAEDKIRAHGYDPATGEALKYEELPPEKQAVIDWTSARKEQADATAALKKAQATNQPAMIALAQRRLESANEAHSIAERRLSLSTDQFEMRSKGTVHGVQPEGGLTSEAGNPVGTAFQQNVRPTTTQRDAAGRAHTMEDLDTRIRTALKNPEILKGTGPLEGRLSEIQGRLGTLPHDLSELQNDLKSYGAFQAGLHPVRGIGGLQYFDKVMGGLGQTPEQLLGKLDSNLATAKSVGDVGNPKTKGSNATAPQGPKEVKTQAEFDALPKGTTYMEDGKPYKKP